MMNKKMTVIEAEYDTESIEWLEEKVTLKKMVSLLVNLQLENGDSKKVPVEVVVSDIYENEAGMKCYEGEIITIMGKEIELKEKDTLSFNVKCIRDCTVPCELTRYYDLSEMEQKGFDYPTKEDVDKLAIDDVVRLAIVESLEGTHTEYVYAKIVNIEELSNRRVFRGELCQKPQRLRNIQCYDNFYFNEWDILEIPNTVLVSGGDEIGDRGAEGGHTNLSGRAMSAMNQEPDETLLKQYYPNYESKKIKGQLVIALFLTCLFGLLIMTGYSLWWIVPFLISLVYFSFLGISIVAIKRLKIYTKTVLKNGAITYAKPLAKDSSIFMSIASLSKGSEISTLENTYFGVMLTRQSRGKAIINEEFGMLLPCAGTFFPAADNEDEKFFFNWQSYEITPYSYGYSYEKQLQAAEASVITLEEDRNVEGVTVSLEAFISKVETLIEQKYSSEELFFDDVLYVDANGDELDIPITKTTQPN